MSDLFYCPEIQQPTSILIDSEAHHAINVLRMKAGDSIRLFDGNGQTADGNIKSLTRREAIVNVIQKTTHPRKRKFKLTVAASPPKGDRLKWMIEKLTELGVDHFIPLQTARTIVQPGSSKLKKLQSTIISAAKQSGCLWLMEVADLTDLKSVLESNDQLSFAHPGQNSSPPKTIPDSDHTLLIGPEGGFTDDEVEAAVAAQASLVTWPNSILRIETAAVIFAAAALSSANPSE